MEEKRYTVLELSDCEWWKLYKTDVSVEEHLRESFPCEPMRASIASGAVNGQDKIRRINRLRTV